MGFAAVARISVRVQTGFGKQATVLIISISTLNPKYRIQNSSVYADRAGLDARAAAIVMRTVRNTVNTGRTVVCTIHQPSIDIFEVIAHLGYVMCTRRAGAPLLHQNVHMHSSSSPRVHMLPSCPLQCAHAIFLFTSKSHALFFLPTLLHALFLTVICPLPGEILTRVYPKP